MDPSFPDEGPGPYRLVRHWRRATLERLLAAAADPVAAQDHALRRALAASAGSRFAARHGLARVRTLQELREAVPARPWEGVAEDLRAVAAGDHAALLGAPPRSFVKTSGTTGEAKLLPVTDTWASEVADAQAMWVLAMLREQPELAEGAALSMVGPWDEGRTPSGRVYGSNTGRMLMAQPWWLRARYAVPSWVHTIPDADLRRYLMLRLALAQPVRSLTTANPSSLLALARGLETHREALSADLRDGTARRGPAADLDRWTRARLWPHLRRGRLAAGARLGEHWRLAAVNCWKGGMAPFFLDRLPGALGASPPVREVGITASEGYFAVPLHSSWWGGVAWAPGHLLELIGADGVPYALHEAELGRTYRLVISTTAGLLRYDLDDYVEVVGHWGRLPVLRFVGKGADISSVTGEKVSASQAAEALRRAVTPEAVGAVVSVRLAERPAYLVCVEGGAVDLAAFDATLRAVNPEYDGKRASDRLAAPEALHLPAGAFARLRARRLAEGAADGQVKDPAFLDPAALTRLVEGAP